MTRPAQRPIDDQRRDISLGRWVLSAVVLFLALFIGLSQVSRCFAPGVPPANILKIIALASAIGATVIPLLPEMRALRIPFLARLWRVTCVGVFVESLSLLASIVWCVGDVPKSFGFLANKLWFMHVIVGFYVVTHFDYLLTGEAPEFGSPDDDNWLLRDDDNGVNVDGNPMFGGIDSHGNVYGVTSSRDDD